MKKLLLIWFLPFAFASCAPKIFPLKGEYLSGPYQITSENSKDQVWDKVIDLFAQKGLPIKLIDRSSGLIISEKSALKTTTENKEGKIINSSAWVVVPGRYDYSTRKISPAIYGDIIGEWNIRIKGDSVGKCLVNVNIVNLNQMVPDPRGIPYEKRVFSARSTGVFEKMIADMVK